MAIKRHMTNRPDRAEKMQESRDEKLYREERNYRADRLN